jgi:hypothetical protein
MMVTWRKMGVGVDIGIRGIWVGRLWSDGREGRWVRREVGRLDQRQTYVMLAHQSNNKIK